MQAIELMASAGFHVEGIMHIGANEGQERFHYASSSATSCIYVEPITEVFLKLQANLSQLAGHIAIQAVCSEHSGETVQFHIANNGGQSSSMLELGSHAEIHPFVEYVASLQMVTTTVDQLVEGLSPRSVPNLLVVDTQGAELRVLMGAKRTLQVVDGLFVEASERPLYEGGCIHEEVTNYLKEFNLHLRWMNLDANGHGDAFYCRGFSLGANLPNYGGNIALNKPCVQSSFSQWSKGNDADGAVNGKKTGSFSFHTEMEDNAWWQVDLGASRPINEVRIYNRLMPGRSRSSTLQILFSVDGIDWKLMHFQNGRPFGGVDGRPLRFLPTGEHARLVRLQLKECNYLHLDEVEIY